MRRSDRCPLSSRVRCTRPRTASGSAGTTSTASGTVARGSRRRRRRGRGSVTWSGPGCAERHPRPTGRSRSTSTSTATSTHMPSAATSSRSGRSATGSATRPRSFGDLSLRGHGTQGAGDRRVDRHAPVRVAVRDRAGAPAGAGGRGAVGPHDEEPGEAGRAEPATEGRGDPPVHPGGDRPRRGGARAEVRARRSCSRRRPGCGRRSGWRSSGATSTATAGVVLVERTCAYGVTKSYGKTARSRRRVPLSTRALEALDATPRRLDVRLVFPGMRGGVIDLKNFRRSQWKPALDSAGIPPPTDLRHAPLVRDLGARRGAVDLRPLSLHGHARRNDRPNLRPSRAWCRGDLAGKAGRRLRETFGPRAGHGRGRGGRLRGRDPA